MLSSVTFRMSTTSHCPEVMAVLLPCRDEPAQYVCYVCVCVTDIHWRLQWINPPWPRDVGVCTQRRHSSPGNSCSRLGQTLVPPERTVDHRLIYVRFRKELKLCVTLNCSFSKQELDCLLCFTVLLLRFLYSVCNDFENVLYLPAQSTHFHC